MPLRTRVGPETSFGAPLVAEAETIVALAGCCLGCAAIAAAKQRSRLAQRRAPEGCVGVAGALPQEPHASASPPRSSQPCFTPSVTAQQSAASSLAPT